MHSTLSNRKAIDEGVKAQEKASKSGGDGLEKFTEAAQGAVDTAVGIKESVVDRGINAGIKGFERSVHSP